MEKTWYTTKEAAKYIRRSVKTVTHYCRQGRLKHKRTGGQGGYLFQKAWLDELLTGSPSTELQLASNNALSTVSPTVSKRFQERVKQQRAKLQG